MAGKENVPLAMEGVQFGNFELLLKATLFRIGEGMEFYGVEVLVVFALPHYPRLLVLEKVLDEAEV